MGFKNYFDNLRVVKIGPIAEVVPDNFRIYHLFYC